MVLYGRVSKGYGVLSDHAEISLTNLIDVGLGSSCRCNNRLDKTRHLGHDIDAVNALFQRSLGSCLDGLAVLVRARPGVLGMARLRPVILRVVLNLRVSGRVLGASNEDLAVLGDAADVDERGAVGGGAGELHHDSRVGGALEVDKVPPAGGVVRLHALKGVDIKATALEIKRTLLGGDGALGHASRPKDVSHGAPWVLEVSAIQSLSGGAGLEAGRGAGELEVDDGPLVIHALDGIKGAILGQLDGEVVGVEARHVLAKVMVAEGCRAPEDGLGAVGVKDFAVELAGCADAAFVSMLAGMYSISEHGAHTQRCCR